MATGALAVGQVGAGLDGFGERVQFKGVKNAFITQKSVQLRPFSCGGEQWVWWQLSQLSCSRGAWRSLRPRRDARVPSAPLLGASVAPLTQCCSANPAAVPSTRISPACGCSAS